MPVIATEAIMAGTERRSARPQPSRIVRGRGSRDHTEPGRRRLRLGASDFARRFSREVAGAGDSGDGRAVFVPPRRDRSMFWKYAGVDHLGNFLDPLRI